MYTTLEQLKAAYDRGDIDAPVFIDNDSTTVYQEYDESAPDSECVFEMHSGTLLEQALQLLGIPWDSV